MTAFIIVDKMLGLDRFQIPSDKTAYARYGKSVIEIPVLLQQYLLDTLRNNVNANFSVKEEIQWVSTAVYCSFFSIKRKLVELNLMSFDASLEDTGLYYQLFTLVEEAVMIIDYSPLYAYLKGKDNICWTKLCGQIQKQIMEYALPKIIEALKLKPLEKHMLLLKILVTLLIIWIVLRTVVTYRVFITFLAPHDRTWYNFYQHYFVRKLPDFFSFQDLKKDLGALDMAKKLSHEDFNMDDLFPTDDQLQWLQARIFELFKHEYLVSGEYVPLNIQPLWALIAIMVPKESEIYNRVPNMNETQLVNTSMIYLRARDKATAELNAIAKKDWEGYFFDQPMAFWAFRQVHINTDKLNRDIEYRPHYVIDTTRND